jgi:uncharacterized OsmC-like protein
MTDIERPGTVNGIDVAAVLQLVDEVAADSAKGMTHWRVATCWQGQTHSRTRVEGYALGGREVARDFTIDIDEPLELGGANRFANPQEYLLAALNGCMTVGYVAQCALRGIRLDHLEIITEGDIDLRGFFGLSQDVAPGYRELSYTVRIGGDASEAQFAEVHAAVMATSPNFYNIAHAVKLNPTLIVG